MVEGNLGISPRGPKRARANSSSFFSLPFSPGNRLVVSPAGSRCPGETPQESPGNKEERSPPLSCPPGKLHQRLSGRRIGLILQLQQSCPVDQFGSFRSDNAHGTLPGWAPSKRTVDALRLGETVTDDPLPRRILFGRPAEILDDGPNVRNGFRRRAEKRDQALPRILANQSQTG